jgi:hypothetical protein
MKRLLLAVLAAGLIGCAEQYAPPSATTGYTYSRYSTSAEVWGYRSPRYRDWTTAQLQQRRLELYGMTTLTTNRNGVPAYIYHGQAQPAQDEAKQIEVELNWRYQHGDKSAELKEFWPSVRRHIASGSRVETLF